MRAGHDHKCIAMFELFDTYWAFAMAIDMDYLAIAA